MNTDKVKSISKKVLNTQHLKHKALGTALIAILTLAALPALGVINITGSSSATSVAPAAAAVTAASTALLPADVSSDTNGSCNVTSTSWACTGMIIQAGEGYTVTATINNPGTSAISVPVTAPTCTNSWTVTGPSGSQSLNPGANQMTWTVTSSTTPSSTNCSFGIT